ncbi:MAG: YceI family protein [Calditrichaeota bacterium]|nr:YceI family protein [Calditrichota bacterium]
MKKITTIFLSLTLWLSLSISQAAETKFIVDDPGGRNNVEFISKAPIENIIGVTNLVTGSITFDPENLQNNAFGKIQVDLRTLNSGIELRDEHMRSEKYLNTQKFPFATFVFDSPVETGILNLKPGETISISLKGKFDLHGITKDIVIQGDASLYNAVKELAEYGYPGEMFNFDGHFKVKLQDFNINRPEFLIMKLAEEQQIHINFTATTGR